MAFQHTLYLKSDSEEVKDLPDNLDGVKYFWQCGARDFADTVKYYGTKMSDCTYEFSHYQVARLLGALMKELMQQYEVYDKAHSDFLDNVKYSEDTTAEMNCVNSYAILRNMDKELRETPHLYYDEFEDSYRMFNIIKGLTSLISRMKENDILVWVAG